MVAFYRGLDKVEEILIEITGMMKYTSKVHRETVEEEMLGSKHYLLSFSSRKSYRNVALCVDAGNNNGVTVGDSLPISRLGNVMTKIKVKAEPGQSCRTVRTREIDKGINLNPKHRLSECLDLKDGLLSAASTNRGMMVGVVKSHLRRVVVVYSKDIPIINLVKEKCTIQLSNVLEEGISIVGDQDVYFKKLIQELINPRVQSGWT